MLNKLGNELTMVLKRFKKENSLDYVFFTGIDIFEGYNVFYTIDTESNNLFAKALGNPNLKTGYKTDSIVMRKQIWPKLESVLNGSNT
jgi:inorganic pyrophosphatase/exopolyphosphatase